MDDIAFRLLGPGDLDLLLGVGEGLFDNPPDAAQAWAFLNDPACLIVLAVAGTRAVGFASGTIILHPDKPPALFVNEVGERDEWQRRGIGRAVTLRLMEAGRERGCRGIWLGTEPDNDAARALYRSLGGTEVPFIGYGWDGGL